LTFRQKLIYFKGEFQGEWAITINSPVAHAYASDQEMYNKAVLNETDVSNSVTAYVIYDNIIAMFLPT
jgi:hypothetical protein